MGLVRAIDLVLHVPLRYEDETTIVHLSEVEDGHIAHIHATVVRCDVQQRPRRQLLVEVQDNDAHCQLRFFNFYPSMQKMLAQGQVVRLRGEIKRGLGGISMIHPSVKPADSPLPVALTPIYPTVAALPQAYLRKAITSALASAHLEELLPSCDLPPNSWSLQQALTFLHYPEKGTPIVQLQDQQHPAWQRLKAEELLAQQLSQWQARQQRKAKKAPVLPWESLASKTLKTELSSRFGFALTGAQNRVIHEISLDMACEQPMYRLLQGDVGSGKTVVAAMAAAQCIANGYQCALMAPTEILARQHFAKLVEWLEPLGIQVAWLTGSLKTREKRAMMALAKSGEARLIVGTHAVISEKVDLPHLGLVIIDEQHRFGVAQRLALRGKNSMNAQGEAPLPLVEPHLLMMSATPIPRTLAMSYYADLSVSTIDELPAGRTPVVTKIIHEERRHQVIERIQAQLDAGCQVYWVCPLIEESEAIDLRNATDTLEELTQVLGHMAPASKSMQSPPSIGLLHSRLPTSEKQAIMQSFVEGHLSVLVSTTVIEVGVDVPNASLMVIEHAERFGLSQLHQLRGRVGRGSTASACILLYSYGETGRLSEHAKARLRAMQETQDGFEIARRDLAIRGPGEFMGERQSGSALLRFANLDEDQHLLEWARELAPRMWSQSHGLSLRLIHRWMGDKAGYLNA